MTVRPRILCVDDEPFVLDGLQRYLRVSYDVVTTTQPHEALELLADQEKNPIAAVLSDMRMPEMTGVAMLERAEQLAPDTTRLLLTGDADLHSAIAAINQGHVFRFLLKPCPPEVLKATIAAAAEQHRLVRAERELLEATLKGAVEALMETLSMAQPELFSRAARLRRLVEALCAKLQVPDAWQVEVAAQMGEIAAITLPPSAIAALEGGNPNSEAEAEMLARLPALADGVLARIPRLEAVREIVRHQLPTDRSPVRPMADAAPSGARLLQAVREYDALVWRGMPPDLAVATLSFRKTHDMETLRALAEVGGLRLPNQAVREIDVDDLAVGDELADDLYSAKSVLLVSRGQVITERLLIRVQNYAMTTGLQGRILVVDL
ncbi:Response regulator receiver domain-containing protein [Micromonospora pattaloongensis]|uniref:Response regulator receiver domain-containing protein n=1 Tax=Micromonospora pattaloongensis TaxID=405436 RepID=A0A1H3QUG1_9ACTN|nr:response regulator [Micromonospora pattaloongensis]SDZ17154.1 Response regulator receiver domain-containing protein [Micromonospora pattaloongensis]